MTVAILINIVLGDSVTPLGATLKLHVVNVNTGVNDVCVNTLASRLVVDYTELVSVTGFECSTGRHLTVGLER